MTGCSILYPPDIPQPEESVTAPDCLADLNLDQLVDSLTAGLERYHLQRYLYSPAHDARTIHYRHEVLADLHSQPLAEGLGEFTEAMQGMREHLDRVNKRHHPLQKQRAFLDAADAYVGAVQALATTLGILPLASTGLRAFRDHLDALLASAEFHQLTSDIHAVCRGLAQVSYCIQIRGSHVTLTRYAEELDYSADVLATFERFGWTAPKEHLKKRSNYADVDPVEGRVLNLVAELFPAEFGALARFYEQHAHHVDATVSNFEREIHFYLSYLRYIAPPREQGLPFCRPSIGEDTTAVRAKDTFDLVLAQHLLTRRDHVVCNDVDLTPPERILVISGPNQGGKTTYARAFGQLHYLAALGLPVPGRDVELPLWDELFTHFEKEEDPRELRGKLQDELERIHAILTRATDRSVIVLNEIFTSTTADDARLLGTAVLRQITDLRSRCTCVTFIDELSSLGPQTVSMTSTVDPKDPATRTFRIVRRAADGLAYAAAIAAKYGLTYDRLRERVTS